jgi:hypothetical protein
MDNAIVHHRTLTVFALAVVLALAVVIVLPKASSAAPPTPVDDRFVVEGYCDFPVRFRATGHQKLRELPGGDFLLTGRVVSTLTNVDNPENQFIDRGGGSGRVTPLTNKGLAGDVLVVVRGHNILFDPGVGIFLTIGKAKITIAGGPGVGGDITILESRGKVIDICTRLE